jgi:hypothetical protein
MTEFPQLRHLGSLIGHPDTAIESEQTESIEGDRFGLEQTIDLPHGTIAQKLAQSCFRYFL